MKVNKEEQARREGMAYALQIAEERGIEGLREELKFRNCTNIPLGISSKFAHEAIEDIKAQVCDCYMILSIATMHDEFGFGQKRCQQFINRFEEKALCLSEDYCTWQDHIKMIKDELQLDLSIRIWGAADK